MGYLSESREFCSPAVWVTFLLAWICRGRSRSVSRLQISPRHRDLKGDWAKVSWSPGAQACATSFGCWMPGWPCSWGGVGEEPLSVRRGAVPGHQLSCPQELWGKGNKLKMASLPYLFREKTAICSNGGGEGKRCSSWRSSACVTCREHHMGPTEMCWWASSLQGMSLNCTFQVRCGWYTCQNSIK